jgi:hypothetical protein
MKKDYLMSAQTDRSGVTEVHRFGSKTRLEFDEQAKKEEVAFAVKKDSQSDSIALSLGEVWPR